MQYKMQFTVLDDAVKQNRKLPEIAFFDTDGNLIHLGGGGGGGDVSALLPRDGSRPMTGPLGFSALDDTSWGSLWFDENDEGFFFMTDPDVTSETDLYVDSPHVSGNGRGSVNIFAGEEDVAGWAAVSVHAGTAFAQLTTDSSLSPGAILSYIWGGVIPTHGRILRSVDNYFSEPYFAMGSDGKIEWGDGTNAPDTVLERGYGGELQISGNDVSAPYGELVVGTKPGDELWGAPYIDMWAGINPGPDPYGFIDLDLGVGGRGNIQVNAGGQHTARMEIHPLNGTVFQLTNPTNTVYLTPSILSWNEDFTETPYQVSLQPVSRGVLEIVEEGGGFKLTSPDGSQTKTIRLSNAGALELV